MTLTLREIGTELQELENQIFQQHGELDLETEKRLDALYGMADEKVENVANWLRNLSREADVIQAEIRSLQKRKAMRVNLATRLESYLRYFLSFKNLKKWTAGRRVVRFKTNPHHVEVVGEWNALSWAHHREPEPDKKAVLAHWRRTGEIPEGFAILQDERLVIE